MRISRIRIALPPRLRSSAEFDARAIAEAAAEALHASASADIRHTVTLPGQQRSGDALAQAVGQQLRARSTTRRGG